MLPNLSSTKPTILLLSIYLLSTASLSALELETKPSSSINSDTPTSQETSQADDKANRSAPIEIEADAAEQNETEGTITYRGNVVITQTNITIHANQVLIASEKLEGNKERQLNRILATGSPATFDHHVNEGSQSVHAQANTISFNVRNKTIELQGDAQLNQSQSRVSGEKIIYNIDKRRVNARSSDDNLEQGRRVKTIISPDGNLLPAIQ